MALININTRRRGSPISKLIYSHFWENFHRCIYGGIYDSSSLLADSRGYRKDVLDALREIKTPLIRWPGGNYVSSYCWEDGIGPKDQRPVKFDPNWRADDSNQFGTDEFLEVCENVGAEPCLVVNIGDGSVREAANWVEYCNRDGNSLYAEKRKKNGRSNPYKVKYWGLGNEVGWKHQVCARLNVDDYIKDIISYARSMKFIDPEILLIASGLEIFHGNHGKQGAYWYYKLLMEAGEWFDYISVHNYFHGGFQGPRQPYEEVVAHLNVVESELKSVSGLVELSRQVLKKERPISIAFDEWNQLGWADSGVIPGSTEPVEDNDDNSNYNLIDGLYTASMLNMFQRMSEYIAMANFSPTVNGRGFLYADKHGLIKRPAYHVFELYSLFTGNRSLDSFTECDNFAGRPVLDVSASIHENEGIVAVAVVNWSTDRNIETTITIDSNHKSFKTIKELVLNGAQGLQSYNDTGHQDDVKITSHESNFEAELLKHVFPAHSVTILQLRP
jgi:alpha-N-arabinofuranosidase